MQFKPFFQNRVAEITATLDTIRGKVTDLKPIFKIDGVLNPADASTQGFTTEKGERGKTVWKTGPLFLREPPSTWPICVPSDTGEIPMEEIKKQTVACIRFRQKNLESPANTAGLQTWLEERM